MNHRECEVKEHYFRLYCTEKSEVTDEEEDWGNHEEYELEYVVASRAALVVATVHFVIASVRSKYIEYDDNHLGELESL